MQTRSSLDRPALRAGLIGFGVVGSGTHGVLAANRDTIRARAGCAIDLTMVATRTASRADAAARAGIEVLDDPMRLARHPGIDVVIEAIGGTTDARRCVMEAIAHGKHVVTANKALLATHGEEIFAAATERGVTVGFEAAVAVSIPIVKALREGLVANEIEWLAGIVNGTSNYVLTQMGAAAAASPTRCAKRKRWAMPRPTPRSTWAAATRRTSWRCWRRWRSAGRRSWTPCTWKASLRSRRSTSCRPAASGMR